MRANRIWRLTAGIICAVLIVLSALCLICYFCEKHENEAISAEFLEEVFENGRIFKEYWFMGGRLRIYADDAQEYLAVAIFDVDMSNWHDIRVLYGNQTFSSREYYKRFGAEEIGGLIYSHEDEAYIDVLEQKHTTVSVPVYSQAAERLQIDGKDLFVWRMNDAQCCTLIEAGSVAFEYEEGSMAMALEAFE